MYDNRQFIVGLGIERNDETIYFGNRLTNELISTDYNGVIKIENSEREIDFTSKSIIEVNNEKIQNYIKENDVQAFAKINQNSQNLLDNPCAKNNGGCNHFCFLKGNSENDIDGELTHTCACEVNFLKILILVIFQKYTNNKFWQSSLL